VAAGRRRPERRGRGAGHAGLRAHDRPPGLDDLAATLHEVAGAAAQLVRADGAGLMMADQAGALRWVTATGEAEQAFERAQRDLDEGPCIDAFARNFERLRRQARSRSSGSTTWPGSSSPAGGPSRPHRPAAESVLPLGQSSGTWRSPGPT
jgi:hypothetical protein